MLALIAFLLFLDFFSAISAMFWLVVALTDICLRTSSPLRSKIILRWERLFRPKTSPGLDLANEAETPSSIVLYKPVFPLHRLIYATLLPQLVHLPAEKRAFLLRGRRFSSLADSIINDTPPPIVETLGLELPPRDRIEGLIGLPTLLLTPPDDGDRQPLPGEKGAAKIATVRGLLAPPKRRSRLGKLAREKSGSRKSGSRPRRPGKKSSEKTV